MSSSSRPSTLAAAAAGCVVEATWLPHRLVGCDLVHHGGGTVPLRSPDPIVLTVHDLQYRTYPAYFTAVKRRYLELTMPRSVRRATVVAVPTEYVRASVIEALRRRSGRGDRGASRLRPPTARRDRRRPHRPAALRHRRAAVRDLPGDHPPAQEPPLPRRAPGDRVDGSRPRARPARWARAGRRRPLRRGRPVRRRRPGDPARSGVRRRSRRSARQRRGARVPVGVRRLRRPAARGDGAGHADRVQ